MPKEPVEEGSSVLRPKRVMLQIILNDNAQINFRLVYKGQKKELSINYYFLELRIHINLIFFFGRWDF